VPEEVAIVNAVYEVATLCIPVPVPATVPAAQLVGPNTVGFAKNGFTTSRLKAIKPVVAYPA
jgi:hypothetical protein